MYVKAVYGTDKLTHELQKELSEDNEVRREATKLK